MARQVLDHGVIIPAEYSDDWYEDMSTNLNKLNEVIGSDEGKLSEADVSDVALSGDYDDLTDKPSFGVLRMTSETLSDSGSGAISNLNSDSKLAAGDYVLDAALKVFPITAVSAPNYTVGTPLFQITNASSLAAVATSGSYDDLNNLPAYGITRFVNAAITDNSNVAFANISSVDKIKAGDFLLDNAGKMYLIASVDTVNETAAVTTPLTQLAVDANVMHLSGDESASGIKSFIGTRTEFKRSNNDGVVLFNNDSFVKGDTPSDTTYLCRKYYGGATSIPTAIGYTSVTVSEQGNRSMIQFYCLANISGSTSRTTLQLNYDKSLSGNDAQYINVTGSILPNANNSYNLGSLSNRWKKFNGINPGALSFPDLSNAIDISGYITAGNTHNEYTPIVDGWISVILKKTTSSGSLAIFLHQGDVGNSYFGNTSLPNETEFCGMASITVKAGDVVNIDLKGNNIYVYSAKFYPNLGNV